MEKQTDWKPSTIAHMEANGCDPDDYPYIPEPKEELIYSKENMVKFVSFVGKNYIKAKGFYYMKGDWEKNYKVSIHDILEKFNLELGYIK